jgi:hypothetical protein
MILLFVNRQPYIYIIECLVIMISLLLLSYRYTSKMLLAAIDENHRGTYDFLYLPIDFKVIISGATDGEASTILSSSYLYVYSSILLQLELSGIPFCWCRINAMWATHLSICCLLLTLFHSMRFYFLCS